MRATKYKFISKKNISTILILVIIIMCGCQEKINIKLDETFTRLVVDGSFSTDTIIQKIKLTTTSDYFHNQPAPTVSEAKVMIDDGDTSILLIESNDDPGVYETKNTFFFGNCFLTSLGLNNKGFHSFINDPATNPNPGAV